MLSSTAMCDLVGCSYRQLDYWTRCRYVVPAIEARGSGSGRRWTERQVRNVRLVYGLSQLGAKGDVLMRASMTAELIPEDNWAGTCYVTADGEFSLSPPLDPAWAVDLAQCAFPGRAAEQQLSLH